MKKIILKTKVETWTEYHLLGPDSVKVTYFGPKQLKKLFEDKKDWKKDDLKKYTLFSKVFMGENQNGEQSYEYGSTSYVKVFNK
jgi:hypothetical protein